MLGCSKCGNEFPGLCTCLDRDARLEKIGKSRHLALTFCSGCGEHVGLCKCSEPKPAREHRVAGRIIGPLP